MFPGAEEIDPNYLTMCMLDDHCVNAESAKEIVLYAASYQPSAKPKPKPSAEPSAFFADECNCQFHDTHDDEFRPVAYNTHEYRPAA
jgi:hypothetical protein